MRPCKKNGDRKTRILSRCVLKRRKHMQEDKPNNPFIFQWHWTGYEKSYVWKFRHLVLYTQRFNNMNEYAWQFLNLVASNCTFGILLLHQEFSSYKCKTTFKWVPLTYCYSIRIYFCSSRISSSISIVSFSSWEWWRVGTNILEGTSWIEGQNEIARLSDEAYSYNSNLHVKTYLT